MLTRGGDETIPAPAGASAAPPAGAPDGPAGPPSRTERVLDAVVMAGGLLCVAIGLTVMAAWFARATAILRLGSQNPMTFNTALGVTVTGAALVAVARRRPRAALAAGVFDVVLGAAVLAEWALGRGLGIDQLIVKAYITGPDDIPGRQATGTAVCLTAVGAGPAGVGSMALPQTPDRAGRGWILGCRRGDHGDDRVRDRHSPGLHLGARDRHVISHRGRPAHSGPCLLSAARRDVFQPHAGFPRWLPMLVGAAAFGIAGAVWQAIIGGSGRAGSRATDASAVLGLLTAGLVALVAWLAQQADERRRVAVTNATRAAAAETAARDSEKRLFRFLDAMPVGVFVATPGGQPYYANHEAERLLGRGRRT